MGGINKNQLKNMESYIMENGRTIEKVQCGGIMKFLLHDLHKSSEQ